MLPTQISQERDFSGIAAPVWTLVRTLSLHVKLWDTMTRREDIFTFDKPNWNITRIVNFIYLGFYIRFFTLSIVSIHNLDLIFMIKFSFSLSLSTWHFIIVQFVEPQDNICFNEWKCDPVVDRLCLDNKSEVIGRSSCDSIC